MLGKRLLIGGFGTILPAPVGALAWLRPDWRYFPFITNRSDPLEVLEAEHRQHAVVELTIRDLKDQALAHFPSGQFDANSAWTVSACIVHNLLRWTTVIGLSGETVRVARTMRRRLLQIPGRLTCTGRQWTLHLPARWPWQHDSTSALARIRGLPELTRTQTAATRASAEPPVNTNGSVLPENTLPRPSEKTPPFRHADQHQQHSKSHANNINHPNQAIMRWIQA